MLCIIQMNSGSPSINPQPIAWIIAQDIDDARRQAQSVGDNELARYLYQQLELRPGKYNLPEVPGVGQRFLLVS